MRPVHWAALGGDLNVLKVLVDYGADPAVIDEDGHNVLDHLPQDIARDPIEYKQWLGVTGPVSTSSQPSREQRGANVEGVDYVQPREGLQALKIFVGGSHVAHAQCHRDPG